MERQLTLTGHLEELRARIIISLVSLALAVIASFPFASAVLSALKAPAAGLIGRLVFFSPQEAFTIYLQIAMLCGWVISMPVILCQLWAFISPGIEERFRRHSALFIIFCFAAFVIGALFAYFILIPPALKFLLSFGKDGLEPVISAQKYISFVTSLVLGCGIVFQAPVLSFILTKLRMINARMLRNKYKYAVVVIFIIAAIITPTVDALNMLLLAGPMIFLYEVSIWVSFLARAKLAHA